MGKVWRPQHNFQTSRSTFCGRAKNQKKLMLPDESITSASLWGFVPTHSREAEKHLESVKRDGLGMVLAKGRGQHKQTLQGTDIPQRSQDHPDSARKNKQSFSRGFCTSKSPPTHPKQGAQHSAGPRRPTWYPYPSAPMHCGGKETLRLCGQLAQNEQTMAVLTGWFFCTQLKSCFIINCQKSFDKTRLCKCQT